MSAKSTHAKNKTKLDKIPKKWPGAFGAFKYSKDIILFNIGNIFILSLISGAFGNFGNNIKNTGQALIVLFVAYIFIFLIQIALIINYFAGADNKKINLVDSVKKAQHYLLNFIIMNILRLIIIILSIMAFIIPFFFILPRLLLSDYYLIDKDLGPVESLKASWTGTKGHALRVLSVIGAYITMLLPVGLLVLIILASKSFALIFLLMPAILATVVAIFLYGAAYTVLYRNIKTK